MDIKNKQERILLDSIPDGIEPSYADRDVVLIDDIRKIPEELLNRESFTPDFYIFTFCLEGRLQIDIKSETFILSPNDVLCNNSNVILKNCLISPDFEARILCLSPQIVSQLTRSGKTIWNNHFYIAQNPIINIGEEGRNLFVCYHDILKSKLKQGKHPFYKESLYGLVSAALYDLHAYLSEFSSNQDDKDTLKQGNLLFKRFIDLLSKEEIKKKEVSYYADKLNVTSKYLSTIVKDVSGRTALKWITEYVVADIKYNLEHSETSIKEIADILGFENFSFFGKYVKKHLGMSPTDYRKELEKQ